MVTEERRRARERHEDIAKQIEREDGLVNTRTTWLITCEALLFSGVGLLATRVPENLVAGRYWSAAIMLGGGATLLALGATVAVRCRDALKAAHTQLIYLRDRWTESRYLGDNFVAPFGGNLEHAHGINYPVELARSLIAFSIPAAGALIYLAVITLFIKFDVPAAYQVVPAWVVIATSVGLVVHLKDKKPAPTLSPVRTPDPLEVDCPGCVSEYRVQQEKLRVERIPHRPGCPQDSSQPALITRQDTGKDPGPKDLVELDEQFSASG